MINKLTTIIMVLNIVILLVAGYMMFWPVQLSEIYNEPFPVYPTELKRGESVSFAVHFNKTEHYEVTSHRSVICADGNLVTLADQSSNTHAPLGEHRATISIVIPEKVSDGECYIQLENTYNINPLRVEYRNMQTQSFNIIN